VAQPRVLQVLLELVLREPGESRELENHSHMSQRPTLADDALRTMRFCTIQHEPQQEHQHQHQHEYQHEHQHQHQHEDRGGWHPTLQAYEQAVT